VLALAALLGGCGLLPDSTLVMYPVLPDLQQALQNDLGRYLMLFQSFAVFM